MADEITFQNDKISESNLKLENKVKAAIRQNKLLKVALEKNNEQVQSLKQIVEEEPTPRNQLSLLGKNHILGKLFTPYVIVS